MDSQRAKRAIKPPKKYMEDEDDQPSRSTPEAEQPIFVYRLLRKKEVNKDLVHQEVYVLWPDNGIWYNAEVVKLRVKDMKAVLEYPKEEESEEVDLTDLMNDGHIALMEPRVPNHRLRKDEFPVPEDTETPDVSQPVLELSEDDHASPDKGEEDEQVEEEEDEDDIPDAGAIEEEPSEGSDVSQAALSNPGSSSSSGEDPMVAEEEAENLEAGPEEEDLEDESMDEAEGSLPSLGKRRSTDTALSGQTSAKRSRPGSLAEVARKQGWRPQTSAPSQQGPPAQHPPASPGQGSQPLHVAQYLPPLGSNQAASPTAGGAAATGVGQSHGADALHSAEAAAARASQIAEAAMTAGAAAEEVAADAEDYETASKYAQELLGSLGKPKGSAAVGKRFYGAQQSSSSLGRTSMGQKARVSQPKPDPQVVRDKVVSNLATSLEKAAAELKKEGHVEGLPDATAVARAVEQALQTAFSTDKEYRQKVRSLSYNLRDASNPELRARVLQGEVTPDRLVQMTPAEMASKELSQWRQQQLQESLRNSVLDEEAAAKFSTAAALAAKEQRNQMAKANYDKGLLTAVDNVDAFAQPTAPMKETVHHDTKPSLRHLDSIDSAALKPPEVSFPHRPSSPAHTGPLGEFAGDKSTFPKKEGEEVKPLEASSSARGSGGSGGSASFNWASIKAHASKLAKDPEALDNRFKGFDEFMASAKAQAATKIEPAAKTLDTAKAEEEDQPYSPSQGVGSGADPDQPDLVNLIASSDSLPRKEVWQGKLHVPGMFRAHIVADMLAGSGDIGRMLTGSEVEVKGRVNLDKLTAFLEELRVSKSRTVSLGTLMSAHGASAADKTHLVELIEMYSSKQRTGVLDIETGLEAYIIPPCQLVDRLLWTAKKSAMLATHTSTSIPDGIEDSQLLLVVIHRKDWKPTMRHESPTYEPAVMPDSHVDSPHAQTSPADGPALESLSSSGPMSVVPPAPGPEQPFSGAGLPSNVPPAPGSEPLHRVPTGAGPTGVMLSAPIAGQEAQAGPMQQLQAALSAQSQGNVLPAGLDLGSISALAAALGVQSVALPGAQAPGPSASSSAPRPSSSGPPYGLALAQQPEHMGPSQPPHDMSHDPRTGLLGQVGPQQQHWGPPQQQPPPATGPGHYPAGPSASRPQEAYGHPQYPLAGGGPDPYPPASHQMPHGGNPGYGVPSAGAARPGMPLPQPITLQTPQGPPGGYAPQPGQLQRPTYHHGPGAAPDQGPYRGAQGPAPIQRPHRAAGHPNGPPAPAYAPVPAHRREGLVGWEGLDSVIGGSRRGRDDRGRGRGGPGRGRDGRGRHSGGRGPASGGRYDQEQGRPQDFDGGGLPGRYSHHNLIAFFAPGHKNADPSGHDCSSQLVQI
ncbi:TPA: hypothetical protein ACH3X2_007918 [Trebouxia sp. C0005]